MDKHTTLIRLLPKLLKFIREDSRELGRATSTEGKRAWSIYKELIDIPSSGYKDINDIALGPLNSSEFPGAIGLYNRPNKRISFDTRKLTSGWFSPRSTIRHEFTHARQFNNPDFSPIIKLTEKAGYAATPYSLRPIEIHARGVGDSKYPFDSAAKRIQNFITSVAATRIEQAIARQTPTREIPSLLRVKYLPDIVDRLSTNISKGLLGAGGISSATLAKIAKSVRDKNSLDKD